MIFTMQITDIFRLSNGLTVLSGAIDPSIDRVPHCECLLMHGTDIRQRLRLEGEMQIKKRDPTNLLRAVATRDFVALVSEDAQDGGWRLVSVADIGG